jgi:enoyl-[acyl-carrier-protein] reductase (NADH)
MCNEFDQSIERSNSPGLISDRCHHLVSLHAVHARPSSLLKRFATVDEVAAMVTYVVSELSSATNGAALRVDGGVVRAIL